MPSSKNIFDSNQAQRRDRCSKYGDSKHREGFKSPARKFPCKTCNKYAHFTSLCYKKKISFHSKTPKVHQLQVGQMYTEDNSICGQSGNLMSSNESFCLQVKIQYPQVDTKFPTPHHLMTNLEYRIKPHNKKYMHRYQCHACQCIQIDSLMIQIERSLHPVS